MATLDSLIEVLLVITQLQYVEYFYNETLNYIFYRDCFDTVYCEVSSVI